MHFKLSTLRTDEANYKFKNEMELVDCLKEEDAEGEFLFVRFVLIQVVSCIQQCDNEVLLCLEVDKGAVFSRDKNTF